MSTIVLKLSEIGVSVEEAFDRNAIDGHLNKSGVDCVLLDYETTKDNLEAMIERITEADNGMRIILMFKGGKTTEQVHQVKENTGVHEVIINPLEGEELHYLVSDQLLQRF